MRRTTTVTAAGVLLATALLAGCGGDDGDGGDDKSAAKSSAYCSTLEDSSDLVTSFTSGSTPALDRFDDFVKVIGELEDEAPAEVADDWKAFNGAMGGLQKALDDYDIEITDLGSLTAGQIPEGVDPEDWTEFAKKVVALNTADVEAAGNAITEHAKKECDVDLDAS